MRKKPHQGPEGNLVSVSSSDSESGVFRGCEKAMFTHLGKSPRSTNKRQRPPGPDHDCSLVIPLQILYAKLFPARNRFLSFVVAFQTISERSNLSFFRVLYAEGRTHQVPCATGLNSLLTPWRMGPTLSCHPALITELDAVHLDPRIAA